jgi:hypothetical protein
MRVKTLSEPTFQEADIKESTLTEIKEQVDERGFYLYDWITPDELRMSVQADYLRVVKSASIPLAVVSFVMGMIGLIFAGFLWVFWLVLATLWIFYTLVFFYLVLKMLQRSYLYTRWADVIITDNHYVSGGKIIPKDDFAGQKEAFEVMEKLFREPLFEPSRLKEYIALERKWLFEQLKEIAYGGGKIIEKLGRSRDSGWLIIALLIGGILYGGMMALVYFLWVFFVAIAAHIFSWIAHRILLATNNLEHRIQTHFTEITEASIELKDEKKSSISLLTEAGRNDWKENLTGKIEDSFEIISKRAEIATEKSIELEKLLTSSQYNDIFNFVKYGRWIKMQILEPLEEIHALLKKNKHTLEGIVWDLERQILETNESSLKRPLELQKERIITQLESFERMITMIEGYTMKLRTK